MHSLTRSFASRYLTFARRFRLDYSVEMYQFDLTSNDVPVKEVDLEFTPALYFFPANDKKHPVVFRHDEFLNEHLIEWLDEVVTIPFTGVIDNQQHGRWWMLVKYNVRAFFKRGPRVWWRNVVKSIYIDMPEAEILRRLEEKTGEL